MRRRQFLGLLGGAAAVPLAARAQQPASRVRRIALLTGAADGDPEMTSYANVFRQALGALGWIDGQNLHIDHRFGAGVDAMRVRAVDMAGREPDLWLTFSTPATSAARQAARGAPIVFLSVSDPIGAGFVDSFARPGGTITGFTNLEAVMGGKWVELIHDIAPSVKRIAMLFNP